MQTKNKNMKKINLLILSITMILSACTNNDTYKNPETEIEQVSYIIGYGQAQSLKSQGLDSIDASSLAKAYEDVFAGNESIIAEEEVQEIMQAFSEKMQAKMKKGNAENKKEMEAYLSDNGAKEGVTTTESGLQYEIIKSGDGAKPLSTNEVTVHYHGTLIDGTVFDSSVDRGEPATFGVTQVIKGWTEALQLMSIGDKWKLTIPSDLAYGDQGAGGMIGPGATLVFEVELLEVK